MKWILLSGSFRSRSRSLVLLNAVARYFPEVECELPALDALPFYSDDLNDNKPDAVASLLAHIESSDGIVVCSPEYNHSIPAVLKNAIDWASRPAFESVLKGKPVTVITQASSPVGGARAQAHIKLVFDSTLSRIHPCHEMMVTGIEQVIDENGQVVDATVERRLKRHMASFITFVQQVGTQA